MDSTETQLTRIQAQIARLEESLIVEYADGSQKVRHPELDVLYRREESLLRRMAAENSNNFRMGVPLRSR